MSYCYPLNAHVVRRGFTLVELMVTVSIIVLTGMIVAPSFGEMADTYRIRNEAAMAEQVIRRTMARSVALSTQARLTVSDTTISGEYYDQTTDQFVAVDNGSYTLDLCTFTRSSNVVTPWVNDTETTSLGGSGTLTFTTLGVPASSSVVYLSHDTKEVAIEILATGMVIAYHLDEGDEQWIR